VVKPRSNSIGALLAHIAVVERSYQVMTFEDRPLSPEEAGEWSIALKLGAEGRRVLRGVSLDHYGTGSGTGLDTSSRG
jgi:hypothetical protein